MKKLLIILALFSFNAVSEIAVIVHPSNGASLDEKDVARIFTGKMKSFPDGNQIIPVNLDNSQAATAEFNEKVLKRSESQLKAYWSKLVFTGKGTPPQSVANADEVIKLVSTNPSVIGYIDASKVTADVKVITTF